MLIWLRAALPPPDQEAAGRLIEGFWDARLNPASTIPLVVVIGAVAWLVAAVSAALALRRAGATRVVMWLLILSGVFLAIDHPFPTGTVAMICLLAHGGLNERQASPRAIRRS